MLSVYARLVEGAKLALGECGSAGLSGVYGRGTGGGERLVSASRCRIRALSDDERSAREGVIGVKDARSFPVPNVRGWGVAGGAGWGGSWRRADGPVDFLLHR
jgi:hypothetical protein